MQRQSKENSVQNCCKSDSSVSCFTFPSFIIKTSKYSELVIWGSSASLIKWALHLFWPIIMALNWRCQFSFPPLEILPQNCCHHLKPTETDHCKKQTTPWGHQSQKKNKILQSGYIWKISINILSRTGDKEQPWWSKTPTGNGSVINGNMDQALRVQGYI